MKTNNGILLLNKEKGITSFGLIKILRRLTGIKKIGHAGTLDPFATGLMILLIGKEFTTQSDLFLNLDKEYAATLFLGKSTDTHDEEGSELNTSDKIPTLEEINEHLSSFQGEMMQTPPMYSAKKVNGQKLYKLARKGITIERKPVPITLSTTLVSYEYPYLKLHVKCSKGTYIRSIAHELGEKLGSHAYLFALERTRVGPFDLNSAISQKDLTETSIGGSLLDANPLSK